MTNFYHDTARRLLVYQPSNIDLICQHVPEAKRLNGAYVAMPATLRNVQVMRWLNHPVPNIMEADGYDWPIERGKKPLAHQKLMAAFMASHPRSFNLSDMGTMKTISTLWAADYVMQQYPRGTCRALIVAPLSILERVWGSAIFANFLGRRTYQIVHGTADKRLDALGKDADFYIINFDGVGIGAQTRGKFVFDGVSRVLKERADLQLCIVDEASAYRDSRTRRHRLARFIITPKSYLWMLTGTPTPNGPTDAFGIAKLVNNAYGENWTSYRNRVMQQWSKWVWKPKAGANREARKLLTPAIRIDIKDVWDGPPSTTQQREVPLTPEQTQHMRDFKRDMVIQLKSGVPIDAPNEAAARLKLMQISMGGIYDGGHHSHPIDASPRLRELVDVVENAREKIVIFIPLTNIIDIVYKHLTEWCIARAKKDGTAPWQVGVINGPVLPKERNNLLVRFLNDPLLRILACDPGTTAHGINEMVAADTAVWYGPTDKTELYLQGNKRIIRPGQKHPTTIVQLVSNPVEREIFRRLESNESLQGLLLGMVKEGKL